MKSNPTLDLVNETLHRNKQALVFVNSKRSAEKTAEDIAKSLPDSNKYLEISENLGNALPRPTTQCSKLSFCAKKGVAFHHAGLMSKQRELIEDSFRNNEIKIICATPTLCLSKDTKIWYNTNETEISNWKISNRLFSLSSGQLVPMKAQKVQKLKNLSNLVKISSVSGYSIKVTPNHKMLVKRNGIKTIMKATNIKNSDKIATIGRLNIENISTPKIGDFILDNKFQFASRLIDVEISNLIGIMLGDGYSGAAIENNKMIYKGSPAIVGKDKEIFSLAKKVCQNLELSTREQMNYGGTPEIVLGKNNWFREFLVRAGVEQRDKKHIAETLMTMNLENTSSLLRGLFDTDGYVEKLERVGFSNTSEKLIKQIQKLLLRYGIVSTIRMRKAGTMKIYQKEYKTMPHFEITVTQKRSIVDFYKNIGFNIKRKQDSLIELVGKIFSNFKYIACDHCKYKIYRDLFAGRTKDQKLWGNTKKEVINLLGEKIELGSREIKKIIGKEPKKNDSRLNHHYELITKRRIGSRSTTEWYWSLNLIGKWTYYNILLQNKEIYDFLLINNCPLCNKKLDVIVKNGWRTADFEGDIFWDLIRKIEEVDCEEEVYDVILSNTPKNDHMFVANGFIVHNSMGLDLPAFRAIIKDIKRYGDNGMDFISVMEYHQMCGRAGRPGKEDYGEAIVITTEKEKDKIVEDFINGKPEEIVSKLAVEPVLRTYLLSLIATDFVKNRKEIYEFFEKTFWAKQFEDMARLRNIINNMLNDLGLFDFIEMDGKEVKKKELGFTSALHLDETHSSNSEIKSTIIGKRVAELYIDPITANKLITDIQKSSKRKINEMTLLFSICACIEMKPLLKVKASEFEKFNLMVEEFVKYIIDDIPDVWDEEYGDYLSVFKTASVLKDWLEEKDEEYILEKYQIRPGELHFKITNGDWLLYCAENLALLINEKNVMKEITKLRYRLKYGVKEELMNLLKLDGVGRVRARSLFNAGYKTTSDIKKGEINNIARIVGKKIALNIKKQLGEDINESSVKDVEVDEKTLIKKEQKTLGDF